ncbi:hypothetical protein MTR67_023198 [Solanum verrucosum]|uniref:Reverse transcriptase/retrotransposon-derived protein RNase H-like domain-containing protein n=1 Tax=Solanum verrucosum TaxID=315347 RepID=A0AAF0TYH3_SOLVR|nr:hypothetical protein MTR67_023198 [Solanum verrucosum]
MSEWPTPTTLRALRGFLGLTGYYRKYVRNYGIICRPLTDLLKKDAFRWNEEADQAFIALKHAMSNAPVLALPDYTKEFIVETDASLTGIGAVLMQGSRPIAYFSKVLAPRHRGKSIYEKEYMSLLNDVDKWRHYLQYKHFVVKTDHHSLKYLLEQKVTTVVQQKGLTKLLGLDYEVQYKKGAENKVADALSRQFEDKEGSMLNALAGVSSISAMVPTWVQEIHKSYEDDLEVTALISEFSVAHLGPHLFNYSSGILRRKGKVYVGSTGGLRQQLITTFHDSPVGGHSGQLGTYKRLAQVFYWPGMRQMVIQHVEAYDVCQRSKDENVPYPGLLQPLPIPDQA